ncbi:hypothetical protein [uncultured Alistipes sp.]|uniref:hypothetical protein n=1 Tax=uncultured Alistipes sp. TaxID=538949 RepID=UPI0027310350|nr:hypothetical protein [uncultured Alistipes sp.]
MKRFLLLLFATYLCSTSYAEEQTKTYTIKRDKEGYHFTTIICRGNFQNGILSDGPIYLSLHPENGKGWDIILEGAYRSDSICTFSGTYREDYGPVLGCYGTIYNNKENRTISKKSSAKEWEIDLRFYLFIDNNPQIKAIPESRFQFSIKKESTESFWGGTTFFWNYTISNNNIWMRRSIAATVYFPNGCKYIGPISYIQISSTESHRDSGWYIGIGDNYGRFEYQYVWSNGDYFVGNKSSNGHKDANPLITSVASGCFHLVDGSILDYEDYWINYIKFLTEQDEYLNPSQLLPILKERKQNEEAKKKQQELERQQEKAREEALQREEQLKKEREQRIKAEQRKAQLIRKYGSKWGVLLAMGKLELGMTKQMCQEVVDIGSYDISKHVSWGCNIETWSFNYERDLMELELTSGIYQAFGITPRIRKRRYSQLEFTDGVLTAIN